jgi:GlpG protein
MRELTNFEDEGTAKRLADILAVRGIEAELSHGRSGRYSVWVLEEGKIEEARAVHRAFEADPEAPEVKAAAGTFDRKRRDAQAAERRESRRPPRVVPGTHTVRVMPVLVGLCAVGALLTRMGARLDVMVWLYIGLPGEVPFARILSGEVWRLVTPIFVHLGLMHLVFNVWWLVDLGAALERRLGAGRFLGLVLSTAILSNSAQYLIEGPRFAGMSGVIYALLGYVFVRARSDASFGLALQQSTVVILLVWLLLGFTRALPGMANYAHLGGLLGGMALGALPRRGRG